MRTTTHPRPNRVNARFDKEDYERLVSFAKATGMSITEVLRLAVRSLPKKEEPEDLPCEIIRSAS